VYAGGGVALLYASKELDKLQTANFDQKIGVQIIQNALKVWEKKVGFFPQIHTCVLSWRGIFCMQTPVHTIASNAGVEGAVVVGKLLEQGNTDLGYDAAKGMMISQYLHANFCKQ
jgi:chaperonin GroEL